MRYNTTVNMNCAHCLGEVEISAVVWSHPGTYMDPPEYEVETVSPSTCPHCAADIEMEAFDIVAMEDAAPDIPDSPYDTMEEADYDRDDYDL